MIKSPRSLEYHEHYSELTKYVSMYNPSIYLLYSASVRNMINFHLDAMDRMRSSEELATQAQDPLLEVEVPSLQAPAEEPCLNEDLTQEQPWISVIHQPSSEDDDHVVLSSENKRDPLEDGDPLEYDPIEDFSDDEFLSKIPSVNSYREHRITMGKNRLEKGCPSVCQACNNSIKFKDAMRTSCNHYFCKDCLDHQKRCLKCNIVLRVVTTFRESVTKKRKLNGISL